MYLFAFFKQILYFTLIVFADISPFLLFLLFRTKQTAEMSSQYLKAT